MFQLHSLALSLSRQTYKRGYCSRLLRTGEIPTGLFRNPRTDQIAIVHVYTCTRGNYKGSKDC